MATWIQIGLITVGGVIALAVLIMAILRKKPIRTLINNGLQGIGAITAVNIISLFSGVSLGYGWFSVITSVVLGIPGVVTLLILKVVFGLN